MTHFAKGFDSGLRVLLLGTALWAWSGQWPSQAASPQEASGQPASASAQGSAEADVRVYTTVPGDTLAKIVRTQFKDSPLQAHLLVQAVRQHNPSGLPAKSEQRIKTGTVLQLPSHTRLVRDTLQALLPADSLAAPAAQSQDRASWVRFP